MAVYRQVHISFWQDNFIMDLTPEEKYFYLYLMTNSKTRQCGCYEISKRVIMFETGYNQETVEKLMDRFIEYGKIEYDNETNEILLVNWLKYNITKSPKLISCIKQEILLLKSKRFFEHIKRHLDGYGEEGVELYRMANKSEITKTRAMQIFERDGFECQRCGDTEDLTIDHIFPRSYGGSNAPSNLRVLCRSCNSKRPTTGDKLLEDLKQDGFDFSDFDKLSGSSDRVSNMSGEEKEKEEEKEEEKKPRAGKFTPPTVTEVSSYCKERKNDVDAERFCDFYQSKNWMVGKNKMKDWRAAVRTWEKKDGVKSKEVYL